MCGFIKSKYLFSILKVFLKSSEYIKNSLILSIFPKFDKSDNFSSYPYVLIKYSIFV